LWKYAAVVVVSLICRQSLTLVFNGEWYVIGYPGFDLHDGGDGDSKLVERFMRLDAGDIRVVYHRNHHTGSPTDVVR